MIVGNRQFSLAAVFRALGIWFFYQVDDGSLALNWVICMEKYPDFGPFWNLQEVLKEKIEVNATSRMILLIFFFLLCKSLLNSAILCILQHCIYQWNSSSLGYFYQGHGWSLLAEFSPSVLFSFIQFSVPQRGSLWFPNGNNTPTLFPLPYLTFLWNMYFLWSIFIDSFPFRMYSPLVHEICSLLYLQHLKQFLAYSTYLINIHSKRINIARCHGLTQLCFKWELIHCPQS